MREKRSVIPNLRLRGAREQRNWSQEAVAEAIGTSTYTISRWERGAVFPGPRYRQKLCTLFAQSPEALGLLPLSMLLETPPAEEASSKRTTTPASLLPVPFLLPPRPGLGNGIVGREDLLASLKELLAGESPASYALYGLPGVGKTSLALALAYDPQLQARFPDGILWAGLGRAPVLEAVLRRWGTSLGVPPAQVEGLRDISSWAQALREAIGTRRLLLIIDDAWSVEAGLACQVGGANCTHLLTTRSPEVALQFAGARSRAIPELTQEESMALLTTYIPQLVAEEAEEAGKLVRAVGGLPLGLVLLGHSLQVHQASEQPRRLRSVLGLFQQREARLTLAFPQVPAAPHTSIPVGVPLSLQASIDVSNAALPSQAQVMLGALAVFLPKPGTFSEQAALAVSDGKAETLDRLVDAGLVESQGAGRYTLHPAISDYARLQGLPPATEQHFMRWAVGWIETYQQDEPKLEMELSLLMEALRLASTVDLQPLLIRGATKLTPFLLARGYYALAEGLLQHAQAAARVQEDTDGLIALLLQRGSLSEKGGDYLQAESQFQEGLRLARQQGNPAQQSALLMALAVLRSYQGELAQAQSYLEEGLGLAQQAGSSESCARILVNLGSIHTDLGHFDDAERQYQEALQLAEEITQPRWVMGALEGLAQVSIKRGNYAPAQAFVQRAVDLAQQHGYRERLCGALTNLGVLALDHGQFDEAQTVFSKSLRGARELGHREFTCLALINLGEVRLRQGQLAEAETALEEALALAQQLNHHHYWCHCFRLLGELRLVQDRLPQAERALQEGLALARASAFRWVLSTLLRLWGDLQLATVQWKNAEQAYTEALELAREINSQELEAAACYGLAQLASIRGNMELARQQGQQSLSLFTTHGFFQAAAVREWLAALA